MRGFFVGKIFPSGRISDSFFIRSATVYGRVRVAEFQSFRFSIYSIQRNQSVLVFRMGLVARAYALFHLQNRNSRVEKEH
jgi:hypothetical protein